MEQNKPIIEDDLTKMRKQLKELIHSKDEMEKEIKELTEFLNIGGFGLRGNLVDKDGFPLEDVNKLLSVREARNKLARLQTDHMNAMKQIEIEMQNLHGTAASLKAISSGTKTEQKPITNLPIQKSEPKAEVFAKIDRVLEGSPAQLSGLKVGDLINGFGDVNKDNNDRLKAVGELVRNSEDKEIIVQVKRTGGDIKISLIPTKWSGNGLLGCHLIPFPE